MVAMILPLKLAFYKKNYQYNWKKLLTVKLECGIMQTNSSTTGKTKGGSNVTKKKGFGKKLRLLRRERNLSIDEAARDIGVSARALRSYEQEEYTPKDDAKKALCNYYEQGVESIFFS